MTDPPAAASDGDAVRVRLDLAYDGAGFAGWARQPSLRTVQGVLEETLAIVLRRAGESPSGGSPRLVVAGRTDAGVHARGQVAHLDLTPAQRESLDDAGRLARRVNGILGADSDVVVHRTTDAPPGFDARFSAVWRRYEYRVVDDVTARDPLERGRTLAVPQALDLEAMRRTALELIGLHDFAAFCRPPQPGATTIRTLQQFEWTRDEGGVLVARLQADAFCHSMVRSLVGACIAVGAGRMSHDRVGGILEARERTSAYAVAPAKGLVLAEVGYPDDAELAARAAQTRARRPDIPRVPAAGAGIPRTGEDAAVAASSRDDLG